MTIVEKKIPLNWARRVQIAAQWTATLLPVAVVLGAALLMFRQAVITSIESTPHPELVYAILGTFFAGVILTCVTLVRYTAEGNLASRWMGATQPERGGLVAGQGRGSYLLPLYQVLLGERVMGVQTRQSVLEQEIHATNARLEDRLTLPHYLAGALVGLGLVGTFVGLLGTLDDLGKLFGALANTDNSTNANPADLFADMVRRLQDPMRGMGTAFVASLYGLLGSLVLGLQILVVGKIGHSLSHQMQVICRQADVGDVTGDVTADEADAQGLATGQAQAPREAAQPVVDVQAVLNAMQSAQASQTQHWQTMLTQMREQHEKNLTMVLSLQGEQSKRLKELADELRQQQERSLNETHILRREILSVVEVSNELVQAVRQNVAADERYRASVPRTSYWQEAWVKVQAYLQRSNTDQTLAQLSQSGKAQELALADAARILARIDQRLGAHLGAQLGAPVDAPVSGQVSPSSDA